MERIRRKRGYMRKGFKRRYFTLTRDSFEYFKTSSDMNPRGTILSTEIVAVSRSRDAVSSEYTLEIVTFERVYFLRAYCENDVIALLDAFRELKERTGFVFSPTTVSMMRMISGREIHFDLRHAPSW